MQNTVQYFKKINGKFIIVADEPSKVLQSPKLVSGVVVVVAVDVVVVAVGVVVAVVVVAAAFWRRRGRCSTDGARG